MTRDPFIVCYHRVVDDFDRAAATAIPSLLISTSMLERHIDWLARHYQIVSLDEIGSRIESEDQSGRPLAAITFDDGYSDIYHYAYPLLKRKGIPAAAFVVTGLVGSGTPQIFDRLYLILKLLSKGGKPLTRTVSSTLQEIGVGELPPRPLGIAHDEAFRVMTLLLNAMPQGIVEKLTSILETQVPMSADLLEGMSLLTWPMIEKMHANGMTIGSHTHSHSLLPGESPETVCSELRISRQVLEGRLKKRVRHFAYPDGRFNQRVVRAVKSAGFQFGYGICRENDPWAPQLTIPRKVLWEKSCVNPFGAFSSSVMNCQAYWAFDWGRGCEHDHGRIDRQDMHVDAAIC